MILLLSFGFLNQADSARLMQCVLDGGPANPGPIGQFVVGHIADAVALHLTRHDAQNGPLAFRARALGTAPEWLPSGLMRRSTISAFNEVYFRRAPKEERDALVHIAPYFYPLDSIHFWNRGYGPQGFVQYQFVVPDGQEDAVRHVLETLCKHHFAQR